MIEWLMFMARNIGFKILMFAIFSVGLGIYTVYESLNHKMNYTETKAVVSSIKVVCARDPNHPDYTGEIDWRPCDTFIESAGNPTAEELDKRRVSKQAIVAFRFISPADQKQHKGEFIVRGTLQQSYQLDQIAPGKTGTIWAHDDDASDYHFDDWPFRPARG